MPRQRNTKTFAVDGMRDVIADGRSTEMHAIIRQRDFTANRIAGYAHDLADARLWAASADLLSTCQVMLRHREFMGWTESLPFMRMQAAITKAKP